MTIALGMLLIVVAGLYVSLPFFQSAAGGDEIPQPDDVEERRRRLTHEKEEAYSALRDAEIDYHTGKLSQPDFDAQRMKYEGVAIDTLAALAAMPSPGVDTPVRAGAVNFRFCPSCGRERPAPAAAYCPGCGSGLK